MRLKDKVTIVTGASQGIGAETARVFAAEGAQVVIGARNTDKLNGVKERIESESSEVVAVTTDVRHEDDIARLVETTKRQFGRVDVLVNNAGIGVWQAIEEIKMSDYERQIDTNLRGLILGCRCVTPLMKEAGHGSIINVSSVHGVSGYPMNSVYAATKGGIIACTRALAAELASHYIRVNTISPGAIYLGDEPEATLAKLKPEHRDEYRRRFADQADPVHYFFQPLELVGRPVDIAYCAVYLASDESRFLTGQNIVVDGGLTTYMAQLGCPEARQKCESLKQEMQQWIAEHKQD